MKKNTVGIAASILSANFACLQSEIQKVTAAGVDWIHLDVMDGHFVPNLTIGPIVVEAVRQCTDLPLDVHLMIENPERYLADFARAGANYLTVHVEACPHLHRTVQAIKELGVKAGVALNPHTPLIMVEEILSELDLLLVMTVNPGFGGQQFIPFGLQKIEKARLLLDELGFSQVILEVDGGVKLENAVSIAQAGARMLVSGSGIFETPDPATTVRRYLEELKENGFR